MGINILYGGGMNLSTCMLLFMVGGLPHFLTAACVGDINLDGSVNVLDYAILRQEMDRNDCFTKPCRADLNGDGAVNNADEDILKSELGKKDCFADTIEVRERNGSVLADIFDEAGVPKNETTQEKEERKSSAAPDADLLREGEKSIPQSTRFKDNGDGTVTDSDTGLVWTKNANLPGDTLLVHQAVQYIEEMNRGGVPNFGHTDWRLPQYGELRSLIDYTRYSRQGHELPTGHPFENVQLPLNPTSPGPAYLWMTGFPRFFSLYCRVVGHNVSSCFGYVWPVRDGT